MAGQHQVPHSGKTGHRFRSASAGYNQPRHFHQAARHHRRDRIETQSHTGTYPCRDGDHVLDRPTQFNADDIGIGIETKRGTGEFGLYDPVDGWIGTGHHNGRRISPSHLPGEGGT